MLRFLFGAQCRLISNQKVEAKLQQDWSDALVELFKKVDLYSKKVKNKELVMADFVLYFFFLV